MLFLRTGTPGAGKTLNTIKELDEENAPDARNPNKTCRTIYYYNIELYTDKLKANWVACENPEEWFNYPKGSIIFIDEAQEIFPNDGKRDRPLKISKFERHRHQGFDIHLVTQHPSLISPHVRKLVGRHVHYYRPFGGNRIKKFIFEFCVDEPQSMSYRSLAQIFTIKLDKKYFNVYKSADTHTHKYKMPKHYYLGIVAVIAFILLALLAYSVIGSFSDDNDTKSTTNQTPQVIPKQQNNHSLLTEPRPNQGMTKEQFINSLKPRIADLPASAPRYDQLNQPITMPKPNCISSTDQSRLLKAKLSGDKVYKNSKGEFICQCYSQQGTKLTISGHACLFYVNNGYFDDTKPDMASYRGLSQAHGRAPAGRELETNIIKTPF